MVKLTENDKLKSVLVLKKNIYKNINVEKLFIGANKITTKFNFNYKNENIIITLLKATLEKNYIYYLEELLEMIYDLKFKE